MKKASPPPPPPGQKQDIAAVVALLRKHKSFAMAASYDLNVLYPALTSSDDVERVAQHEGIQAVLACLENVRAATAAGSTLLESATRVLCRCLALVPETVAPVVVRANGVALVVRALRDGDENRPVSALQFLGLMADAGYEDSIRATQGGELLVQLLLKEEDEVQHEAMLALGKIARAALSCDVMLPEASRRALLADAVIRSLVRDAEKDDIGRGETLPFTKSNSNTPSSSPPSSLQTPLLARSSSMTSTSRKKHSPPSQQQQHHFYSSSTITTSKATDLLHAQISLLLWLTTTTDHVSRGELTRKMATSGLAPILLQHIQIYEKEASVLPPTLLPLCGQLLFVIVEGPLLEQAFQATATAATAATSGSLPPEMCLAVVSAISLCAEGRRAIMEAKEEDAKEGGKEDVLNSLLYLCKAPFKDDDEYFIALLTALHTLERLAADLTHAPELLQRKTMDAAMHVLDQATKEEGGEGEGEERMVVVPENVVAAATCLVARLTEMMMLLSNNDDEQGAIPSSSSSHRRTSSGFGTTDTKLQALRCALAAFARHPESQLLFGSVVDLALSSLRSTRTASSALDALCRLLVEDPTREGGREGGLSRSQRVVLMREKMWSERGLAACVAALRDCRDFSEVGEEEGEEGSSSSSSSSSKNSEVQEKTCRLLARVLPAPSQDRRKSTDAFVFHLQSYMGLEELYVAVEGMVVGGVGKEGLQSDKAMILAFVRPVLEARKLQEEAAVTRRRNVAGLGACGGEGGGEEEKKKEKEVGEEEEYEQPLSSRVNLRHISPERLEMEEEEEEEHEQVKTTSTASIPLIPSSPLPSPVALLLDIPDVPSQAAAATTAAVSPSPPPLPHAPQPDEKRREKEEDHSSSRNPSPLPPTPPPPASLPPLPPAPAWLQVVQAQGRVYFVNTETGSAQYELPPELSAWWELQAQRRAAVAVAAVAGVEEQKEEEEVLCEMPEWMAKVDPKTRMVFFVPRQGGGEGGAEGGVGGLRRYRLPTEVPAGFLGEGMLREPSASATASVVGAAAAAADMGGAGGNDGGESSLDAKIKAEEQEQQQEQEEAEARALLQELGQLQEDMVAEAACLASGTKPNSSVALSQRHAALLRRIKKRPRASLSSSSSSGKELEEGLCDALRKALERVEDTSSQLSFYKDLYEREKTAHERKGDIAGLEATMALVKGEVLQHTPEELPRIAKILAQIERNPNEGPELLLKEAHLLIKRIVLRVGGEQKADTIWSLTLPALDNIPDMYMQQLRDQLRVLVIAYDNLTLDQKARLKTASEIVKNRSWLVQLAVRCAEHGQAQASERAKAALTTRLSPPAVSLARTSSSGDRSSSSSSSSAGGGGSGASTRRAQAASPRALLSSPATAKSPRTTPNTTTPPASSTSTSKSSPAVRRTSLESLATPKRLSLSSPRTTTATTTTITPPALSTSTSKSSAAARRTSLDSLATPKRPVSMSSKINKSPSPGATTTSFSSAPGATVKKGVSK